MLVTLRSRFLVAVVCLVEFLGAFGFAEADTEPYYYWNGNQFISSFGRLPIGNSFVRFSEGSEVFSFDCIATSTHTRKANFEFDYESEQCGIHFEKSIGATRLGFDLKALYLSGGVFDSSIRGFHDAFGFSNGPRNSSNDNQFSVQGRLENGNTFSSDQQGWSFLNPSFAATQEVAEGYFATAAFSIPLSNYDFASSSPEVKLSIMNAGILFSELSYLADLEGIYRYDNFSSGLTYASIQIGSFSQLAYPISNSVSLFLAQIVTTRPEKNLPGLTSYDWYVDFGGRYAWEMGKAIEIALRENLAPAGGSADVSLVVRLLRY